MILGRSFDVEIGIQVIEHVVGLVVVAVVDVGSIGGRARASVVLRDVAVHGRHRVDRLDSRRVRDVVLEEILAFLDNGFLEFENF